MKISGQIFRMLAILIFTVVTAYFSGGRAYAAGPAALAGTVSSDKEGKMEGVLVSAKGEGSNITVTVVSDKDGHYAFPGDRLKPGKYNLKIRAIGYDLDGAGMVELAANKTKDADLKLVPAKDIHSQLTNAEWIMSAPGAIPQKLVTNSCVGCHSISVPLTSRYDTQGFLEILHKMRNFAEASIYEPGSVRVEKKLPYENSLRPTDEKLAAYLSTINLSSDGGKWQQDIKTLPRLTGDSGKAIITEYDLPRREAQPHDAAVDKDGIVWNTDVGGSYLDRLDPKTGEVKEFHVPVLKPNAPGGGLDIQFDKDGNPWISMMYQGGIAKFDKKTEKFTTWLPPDPYNTVTVRVGMVAICPDGRVWFKDSQNHRVFRLDQKTNHIEAFDMPSEFYGMRVDSKGNLFLASLEKGTIGEIESATGEIVVYPTPTPNSGARRGDMDDQDRFWFGEYYAGKIGMFDTKAKSFKEWDVPPMPWSAPYAATVDKNGEVWAGGEHTDYVFRLNPTTGKVTTYSFPTLEMNIQRVSVDSSTKPVTVWIGENHQAKIAKLEVLE